jgi:glycosyltransferase involved in cell wall biosynthesis
MTVESRRPLVTIGIPTYNRAAATLPVALRSALDQTYRNIEIVVSDNASTDATEALVRGYADSRIRYVRHPQNIGANNNFNFCVEQARGAYFLLLHDDDLIDPDFVATCMDAVADSTEIGIIRTGLRVIDGEGALRFERVNSVDGTSITDLVRAWYENRTSPYCCNTLCNTAGLQRIGGYHSRHDLFQDVLAQTRLAAQYGYVIIADVKASFRRHEANMGSAARVRDWCEDSLELLDVICSLAPADASLLHKEGMRFFCLTNYTYVPWISSPMKRLLTYLMVARLFDFAESPLRFAYRHEVKPFLRAMKRRALGGAVNPSLSSR